MKYQKALLNALIIFFLFFTLSAQAEGELKKNEIRKQVEERKKNVYEKGMVIVYEAGSCLIEGVSTIVNDKVVREAISNKAKIVGHSARFLDIGFDAYNILIPIYNMDPYGTGKALIDTLVVNYLVVAVAGGVTTIAGTTVSPVLVAGGIGIATAAAYNRLDPIKRLEDVYDYARGMHYSYQITYENAEISLLSCDLNNANEQIDIAEKDRLMHLKKSKAKCIYIAALIDSYKAGYAKELHPPVSKYISGREEDGSGNEQILSGYKYRLSEAKREEKKHSDFLVKILKFKKDYIKKNEYFNFWRGYYRNQIDNVRNTSSGSEACRRYEELYSELSECEKTFIETNAPSLVEEKKKLMVALNTKNNYMSLDRLNTIDNFHKSASCSNIDSLLEKFENYQDKINQNNLYEYAHNECNLKSTVYEDTRLANVSSILYSMRDRCRLGDRASADDEEKRNVAIAKANCDKKRPGSTPHYFPDIEYVYCFCVDPLVLSIVENKCIRKDKDKNEKKAEEKEDEKKAEDEIKAEEEKRDIAIKKANCSDKHPGSIPLYDPDTGIAECICQGPVLVWDKGHERCVTRDQEKEEEEKKLEEKKLNDELEKLKCKPNFVAQYNEVKNEPYCFCDESKFEWDNEQDKCMTYEESDYPTNGTFYPGAYQDEWLNDCDKILPGSISDGTTCVCPQGTEKSQKLNICVVMPDENKTEHIGELQIIYRVQGSGLTPHYSGSYRITGHEDFLVTLEEPATEEYMDRILSDAYLRYQIDPCEVYVNAYPTGNRPPAIWKPDQTITIIRGPTSGLSSVKLEKTWRAKSSDGPYISEIKKAKGCK